MSGRKVLVCGGRDYGNRRKVYEVLDGLHLESCISRIVTGGANGADMLASDWAAMRSVSYVKYPADWETHGRAAGPIRNQEMLNMEHPDLVVAFPGGRGTANMIRLATNAKTSVKVV